MMSELRKDLVSGRWVIIATERAKRPDDFRPGGGPAAPSAEPVGFCPFCEGNEGKTPPEVFALRAPGTAADSPGWTVRVVPNKFPALNRGTPPPKAGEGVFQWMEGTGVHEVVIENPVHAFELSDLPVAARPGRPAASSSRGSARSRASSITSTSSSSRTRARRPGPP
ncbi:MAG: hypothetical protein MZV65_53975 [Chromatiales bacterium]|nr:hypothetical protein [Chromatiales bacterium]